MVVVTAQMRQLLCPGKSSRQEETEKQAIRFEDAGNFRNRSCVVGDMFEYTEADYYIEGCIGIRDIRRVSKRGDWNLKPLQNWCLLAKGRIILIYLKITRFKARWTKIAKKLTDVSFTAAPVKNRDLIEGASKMMLRHDFNVVSEIDISVLARRIL